MKKPVLAKPVNGNRYDIAQRRYFDLGTVLVIDGDSIAHIGKDIYPSDQASVIDLISGNLSLHDLMYGDV